jgi:uncharacterized protein (DUF433 family)
MDWKEHIISDNSVLLGKPTIKGTRISVEFLVKLLAAGWTEDQILANYPRLKKEDMQAVFAYIHECIQDGLMYDLPDQTAS